MRTYLLSVLFLFLFAFSYAQKTVVDSFQHLLLVQAEDTTKVNTLNRLAVALRAMGEAGAARENAKSAATLADKINFKRGKAVAYSNISFTYSMEINYEEAENYLNSSLNTYTEIGARNGIAYSLFSIASNYVAQRKYAEALKVFLSAIRQFETLKNRKGLADCYKGLGGVYREQQINAEALRYYFKALGIYEQLGIKADIAACLVSIGLRTSCRPIFRRPPIIWNVGCLRGGK
jgi:tetratricopeptide (TPR) repeat protein